MGENRGNQFKYRATMQTVKTSHLSGIERVINFDSEYRVYLDVWMVNYEVIKVLKKKFYYMQVKMTGARGGKLKAINASMEELRHYVALAKKWVATQQTVMTNFERDAFNVLLISHQGAKLLNIIVSFDQVMCDLAAAQFAGGQRDDLRLNYLHGFLGHFNRLFDLTQHTDAQFHASGQLREIAAA